MLAEVRERVLSAPFRDRTGTKMWRAAETAAESAKGNADAALAMLRMRACLFPAGRCGEGFPDYPRVDGSGHTSERRGV